MSYKAHDIVTTNIGHIHETEAAALFRALRGELRAKLVEAGLGDGEAGMLSGLLVGPIRGADATVSYALLPDGSKEHWPESDVFDEVRQKFISIAARFGPEDVVHVRFGGDLRAQFGRGDGRPAVVYPAPGTPRADD